MGETRVYLSLIHIFGRGLRLCVNQEGERMDESVLGGAVQELNKLTLITDMEFGRFAEALQQGLAASLAGRPRTVEPGLFAGRLLTGTTGARVRVRRELAEEICAALRKQGYVKDRVLTGSFFAVSYTHLKEEIALVLPAQFLDELGTVHGDLLDLLPGLVEHLPPLGLAGGVVEVDDGPGGALHRLKGCLLYTSRCV